MALNHFVSRIKHTQIEQAGQIAEQTITAENLNAVPVKQSRLAQLEAQRINSSKLNASAPKLGSPTKPLGKPAIDTASVDAAIQSEPNVNPALKEIPLSWSDQQMLCALSAMQIRYGRSAEAIPYLMMVRKINPKNIECSRLLALAFMRLNRWQEAEAMVEEYDYLQKANAGNVIDGIVLLYRSLVSFKTNKIADAKSWFGKFRSFNKVS